MSELKSMPVCRYLVFILLLQASTLCCAGQTFAQTADEVDTQKVDAQVLNSAQNQAAATETPLSATTGETLAEVKLNAYVEPTATATIAMPEEVKQEVTAVAPLKPTVAMALKQDCIKAGKLMADAVMLGNASKSEEDLYRQAISLCPEMAEVHHNLGVVLARQKRNEEAIASFEKAIELKDDPAFRVSLGLAKINSGKLDEAIEVLRKALEKSPSNVKALQAMAIAYERQGKIDQAIDALNKARAIDERNVVTLFNLGVLYERRGLSEVALEAWEKALQVDPRHFDSCFYLGVAYQKMGRLVESEMMFKRALEIKPDRLDAYRALSAIYDQEQDLDKAELTLRRAMIVNDKEVSTLVNLSIVLLQKKQESQALEIANKALALDGRSVNAHLVKGWALIELGQFDQAESTLDEALQLDGSNAVAHNALGVLYQRQGRVKEANEHFDVAKKLNPQLEIGKQSGWRFW